MMSIRRNSSSSSLVSLVTFQMLNSHMRLVVIILDSAHVEYFHHCQNFYWITLYLDNFVSGFDALNGGSHLKNIKRS